MTAHLPCRFIGERRKKAECCRLSTYVCASLSFMVRGGAWRSWPGCDGAGACEDRYVTCGGSTTTKIISPIFICLYMDTRTIFSALFLPVKFWLLRFFLPGLTHAWESLMAVIVHAQSRPIPYIHLT
ncbi:hypothetical protein IF2G_00414 [Cordyceps javanica]|nr:hypothetical protein IF2G_00414 [Cordyceps javanica]